MAAIGGRRTPEYTGFSFSFFHQAVSLIGQSRVTVRTVCESLESSADWSRQDNLQRLQCQTLLIDFAIWADDSALRQWALCQFPVAIAVRAFPV